MSSNPSQQAGQPAVCSLRPEDSLAIYGSAPEEPKKERLVEFFAYETIGVCGTGCWGLHAHLKADGDIRPYEEGNGKPYERPRHFFGKSTGFLSTKILPELSGVPFSNVVLAYCHGFHPSAIRVSRGEVCCDALGGRITIYLTEDDKVDRIVQEISVLYGSGADVAMGVRSLKEGSTPPSSTGGSVMHTAALDRVKFD